MDPAPARITVANDNEDDGVPEWLSAYPIVEVCNYSGNRGPARARNIGAGMPEDREWDHIDNVRVDEQTDQLSYAGGALRPVGRVSMGPLGWKHPDVEGYENGLDYDWLYFTDCGCQHHKRLFSILAERRLREGDSLVAICGSTTGRDGTRINRYMTVQGILNPPVKKYYGDKEFAQGVVTANVLIYALAFSYIRGFDPQFPNAAAEDIDLGIRLSRVGLVVHESAAQVSHEFDEDMDDFRSRFTRYGRGMRLLEMKHNLPSLRAAPFAAEDPDLQDLANLQVECIQSGYDEIAAKTRRGLLVPPDQWASVARDGLDRVPLGDAS